MERRKSLNQIPQESMHEKLMSLDVETEKMEKRQQTGHFFLLSHKKTCNGMSWRPASKSSPLPILDTPRTQDLRGIKQACSAFLPSVDF